MDHQHAIDLDRSKPGQAVFNAYAHHNFQPRTNTELTMLEKIRQTHPQHGVTLTQPATVDLLGFAKAGHARLTRDQGTLFDATRNYSAPKTRLDTAPGELKDHIRFARFEYVWNEEHFIVYQVEYLEPPGYRGPTKLFYVLDPHSSKSELSNSGISLTDKLLLAAGAWTATSHDEIYVFDDGRWKKSKALFQSVSTSSWEEVILNPTTKSSLIGDVMGFFDNRALYQQLAVPWKRGLIFHGVPGNGKTITIKALIKSLYDRPESIPSLYVKSFDACQGQKWAIKSIFTQARSLAPCLLVFEDLDSLITDKTRSYFLNEVDGLENNEGILMIGSTNHLSSLDPAISKRPSRFDRKYHFKLPDLSERTLYCEFWRKKLIDSFLVDFEEDLCPIIAKLSEGFSFAYMKELFVIALLTIARGGEVQHEHVDSEDQQSEVVSMVTPVDTDPVIVSPPASPSSQPLQRTDNNIPVQCSMPDSSKCEEKPAVPKKKKRVLPAVDVPLHLQDNVLLKVVKSQLKTLLEEMDNTNEDEWPTSKAPKSTGGGPAPWPFRPGMLGGFDDDDDDCC